MKQLISFLFVTLLLIMGCNNESELTSPVENNTIQEPNWIALPQAEGLQVNTEYTQTASINGTQGGRLECGFSYSGGNYGQVTGFAQLVISSCSYPGRKNISMTLSNENTSVIFGPELNFNSNVYYSVTYTGINLNGIDPQTVKFAYIANDGSIQYAQHEGITVDFSTGTLSVHNALLPHFSR